MTIGVEGGGTVRADISGIDGIVGMPAETADVAARLEAEILSGTLPPGARLSELALSARYGVGRAPLREAIRRLEGRRLVERTSFAGARVVSLSLDDFEQLLVTREVLEGLACRQAAECMTLHETRRLRSCLVADGTVDPHQPGGVFAPGDPEADFHVQIVRGSRNGWLFEVLCRDLYTLLRMFRVRSAAFRGRSAAAAREHLAILEAIERRDPEAAERHMRRHVAAARANLIPQAQARPQAEPEPARDRSTPRGVASPDAGSILGAPLISRSLVDTIVDRLQRAIVVGELAPGARLSEVTLATSLGVSRGPLREAIQQLEGRRLVRRVPHAGARVVALTQTELQNVLITRDALEGLAARLAAERMTPADVEGLRAVVSAFRRRAGDDAVHLHEPAADFHYCIALGSRNRYLIDLLCKDLYYLLKLYRFRSGVAPGRRRDTVVEHLGIIDAIAARDGPQAERLMHDHLRKGREWLERRDRQPVAS